jgi:AcrR family transcriptional regulator
VPYASDHRDATRERIVASARRLFNRRGLEGVSIDEIMAGAGLTRGGFYSYFDSKEELYAEAITLFVRTMPSERWQCAAEENPPRRGRFLPAASSMRTCHPRISPTSRAHAR